MKRTLPAYRGNPYLVLLLCPRGVAGDNDAVRRTRGNEKAVRVVRVTQDGESAST